MRLLGVEHHLLVRPLRELGVGVKVRTALHLLDLLRMTCLREMLVVKLHLGKVSGLRAHGHVGHVHAHADIPRRLGMCIAVGRLLSVGVRTGSRTCTLRRGVGVGDADDGSP